MIARHIGTIAAAMGLAFAPLASDARALRVPACGGGVHYRLVPADPLAPRDEGGACAKACHAITDRREKAGGKKRACC